MRRFKPLKSNGIRLVKPLIRGTDGKWAKETWETTLDFLAEKMNSLVKDTRGEGIFGLVSSRCSNADP
ncbi:MAG: molybdopterin-dependent oxidoreductase [Deltaproteobacteria bacterium]|nr:molybdopterin-dependent oxidoreductase [Deltaproteobacteria bacterium]MBW2086657.1 molybdopterin-dependent oxidoreductase [Deltaproteobacteria bacterium]